ncbi:hypothetical protein Tco_1043440 [Tanacetum coccineum]|uniref:Uncharacterized protein n=1 Tax=Tanacetum coccineum TaxID=301880 RepID=A0ABQ5GM25_9ASTR
MQFLMGLDDSYMQTRSSILSREVLPDVRSAYATISSEESHRVASGSIGNFGILSKGILASAFVFDVPNRGNFQRGRSSNTAPIPNNLSNNRQNGGSGLICKNCRFNVSTALIKFFKKGDPSADFRKNKSGKNTKGKNISNNNVVGSSSSSGFTDEQMATLISLIKDNKVGKNV